MLALQVHDYKCPKFYRFHCPWKLRIICQPSGDCDVEVANEHDHAPEQDRSACMKLHVKELVDKGITEEKAPRAILCTLKEKKVSQEHWPSLRTLRTYITNNKLRLLGVGEVKRMDQMLVEAQRLNLLKIVFDKPELDPTTVGYIYVVDNTYLNEHNELVPIFDAELFADLHASVSVASIPEELLTLHTVIQQSKACHINRLDRSRTCLIHVLDNT